MDGQVVSVNVSRRKHVAKESVAEAELRPDCGLVGDAHAKPGNRQVSLLAIESIERQQQVFVEQADGTETLSCPRAGEGLAPGVLRENLTTRGLDFSTLPPGTRLKVGREVVLEVSQIGRQCGRYCATYGKLGDCAITRQAAFARVITGGVVRPDDEVRIEACGAADGESPVR